jgi:hypothetical protein
MTAVGTPLGGSGSASGRDTGGHPVRATLHFVGPPAIWLGHLCLVYLLVAPACGGPIWPIHLLTAVAVAGTIGCLLLGLSLPSPVTRLLGVALAVIFLVAIVAAGFAAVLVDPCVQ